MTHQRSHRKSVGELGAELGSFKSEVRDGTFLFDGDLKILS